MRGGDGALRRIRFLQGDDGQHPGRAPPHRRRSGSKAARDGALGRNWVERADGSVERFGATHTVEMHAGDVFAIETPGGGADSAPPDAGVPQAPLKG